MGISLRSGSTSWTTTQETSGSACEYLFSPNGPYFGERNVGSFNLKENVVDSTFQTLEGPGQTWRLPPEQGAGNPVGVFLRTLMPANCTGDWYIQFEVQFQHSDGNPVTNKVVSLSTAGRLSSGGSVSKTNGNNAGEWTNSANADFTTAGGLKYAGFWPISPDNDGNNRYPIDVPAGVAQNATTRSRFIKLSEFVNSAESASDFRQGGIIDTVIQRDQAIANELPVNLDVLSIKVRFTEVSGS